MQITSGNAARLILRLYRFIGLVVDTKDVAFAAQASARFMAVDSAISNVSHVVLHKLSKLMRESVLLVDKQLRTVTREGNGIPDGVPALWKDQRMYLSG